MCETTDKPVQNTDRELYREGGDSCPADTLFVTEGGGIGMNVSGKVIVMPLRRWHSLAYECAQLSPSP